VLFFCKSLAKPDPLYRKKPTGPNQEDQKLLLYRPEIATETGHCSVPE